MRNSIVVCLLLAVAALAFSIRAAQNTGAIAGVVKDASGKPLPGIMIKARNDSRGVTFAVISRARGQYTVSNLPTGTYTVQGVGGGLRNDPGLSVEVSGSSPATADLTLNAPLPFQEAMTASHFGTLVSDDNLRETLIADCSDCHHSMERIVPLRLDQKGWTGILEKMRHASTVFGYYRSLAITDQKRDEIADALAKNFGPDKPPLDAQKLLPRFPVPPEASNMAIVEFDVPEGAEPHDVAVDSHGVGWVAELFGGFIGRVDPVAFTYTRIAIPGGKSRPEGTVLDEAGRVWFGDAISDRLMQYDPRTKAFAAYPLPKRRRGTLGFNSLRVAPTGAVWMTNSAANQISRFDPKTQQFTAYAVPSGLASPDANSNPYGIAIDGSGKIWFAERRSPYKVGRVDPATGKVTEYELPTKGVVLRRMAADAEGNLWFGEFGGVGKLGMIDYRTGKITEYATPTKYSGAYSVDVDRKHNLIWVNEMMGDKIARFDPRTKTFVEYPLPTHYSSVRRIEVDRNNPNRIWYTAYNVDKIGYLEILE